ncbi:MAG: hypothetical protein JXA54_12970 [Candidatus Heimdallarchaeota archaeon]|nr:hypothetical protein [Candidatus Heimdallarchaeota archaeon]
MYVQTYAGFLDIVNITDITNTTLISSLDVGSYWTIEQYDDYLFIYGNNEGSTGIIYDITNKTIHNCFLISLMKKKP